MATLLPQEVNMRSPEYAPSRREMENIYQIESTNRLDGLTKLKNKSGLLSCESILVPQVVPDVRSR